MKRRGKRRSGAASPKFRMFRGKQQFPAGERSPVNQTYRALFIAQAFSRHLISSANASLSFRGSKVRASIFGKQGN